MNREQNVSTILVIEDEHNIRTLICWKLRKAGHTVIEAVDGRQGVYLFCERSPDLVITDIIMPDKEGLETITELRAKKQDVKIVAISGGGYGDADGYLVMAKALGARATLTKPFKMAELLAVSEEVLG